jgi:hypothetical protein
LIIYVQALRLVKLAKLWMMKSRLILVNREAGLRARLF